MYNLVTTSIEETWDKNKPILFIGEWCRNYNRRDIWKQLNWSEIQFEKDQRTRIIEAQFYTSSIKEELLCDLTKFLNKYHKLDFEIRHWNIILGHWLTRYVDTMYDRFFTIKNVLDNYDITSTIVFNEEYIFSSSDTSDFTKNCNSDIWNHFLYVDILKYFKFDLFVLNDSKDLQKNNQIQPAKPSIFIKSIKKLLNYISCKLSFNNTIFILTTYLPYKHELILNILLKQVPAFWATPEIIITPVVDLEIRTLKLDFRDDDLFAKYVFSNALRFLPKIFLEDFSENWMLMNCLKWPLEPKIIFVSNHFDTNEIFKLYLVKNLIKNKSTYLVGQHGAHYGTTMQYVNYPEYMTSDFFLTWGWSNSNKDIIGYNFKTSNKFNTYKFSNQKLFLFVQMPILHRNVVWNTFSYQNQYQKDQFQFLSNINNLVFDKINVRLHHESLSSAWNEKQRFSDKYKNLKFDNGYGNILNKYLKSKLVIHSYDSTGILECLSMNVPMIAFWSFEIYPLNNKADEDYEILKKAGILYDCPVKAAIFINSINIDIEEWWNRPDIQSARLKFCNKYSKIIPNPLSLLKHEILNISKRNGN
jgi:putative transferase (TIGR04331 family)